MVWNDTTNNQGLVQEVNDFLKITNTDYSLPAKARSANTWLEKAAFNLMISAGAWQYDDPNYTNLPIFTTDLVSGQQNYTLSNTYYSVRKVLIKDSDGNWNNLKQIDIDQDASESYLEQKRSTGQPSEYDIYGDQIVLDRAPNYNSTGGLKVYVERRPDYFLGDDSSGDNDKEPGIPSIFHKYIAYGMIYDYAERRDLPSVDRISVKLREYEEMMKLHGARRNKGKRHRLTARKIFWG